ncbi:hypothetical protein DFJ63DRAFT_332508 [Scheffersomyces coipomensis]|uniref:uncharacterized protein n=1 Tax=Scheffersomyces coipomensis TaxID=1788519 RepID=UPI00315D1B58
MISSKTSFSIPRVASTSIQQVRYKRKLAYPQYTHKIPKQSFNKKDHSSFFQRAIKEWLGPKNIRGEYYRNKYYYPPQNHRPNYIVPDGNTIVGKESVGSSIPMGAQAFNRDPTLHPFPQNIYCKTSNILPHDLKGKIVEEVSKNGLHVQEVAHKYGIKIARIEGLLKLHDIEKNWEQEGKLNEDLTNYSEVMYKMFPLYQPPVGSDNLTEIPTPHKTLTQRFLTIAESEPFGPIEAAELLELPVASDTLSNLSNVETAEDQANSIKQEVVVGTQKEGDRVQFKFTTSKVGNVGFRYGASRRDTKKNRGVGFDSEGRMVYI